MNLNLRQTAKQNIRLFYIYKRLSGIHIYQGNWNRKIYCRVLLVTDWIKDKIKAMKTQSALIFKQTKSQSIKLVIF